MPYARFLAGGLAAFALVVAGALLLSGVLTSEAVQAPKISIDMDRTGNTYAGGETLGPSSNPWTEELGNQCGVTGGGTAPDSADQDADGFVNDACPTVGGDDLGSGGTIDPEPETGTECANGTDDDPDDDIADPLNGFGFGLINDGCPSFGSMTVGEINGSSSSCPANSSSHTHQVHVVITEIEDLIGWQVRVNYDGGKMRPSAVNFLPFTDSNTGQNISFVNMIIDPGSDVHRSLISAENIPSGAPAPQTASFGSIYGGAQTFAISSDTPPKPIPDNTSYIAPSGGVLALLNLQVLAGNAGETLFMDVDDGVPNPPGTGIAVFDGTQSVDISLSEGDLGDGTHNEGVGCSTPPPTPPPCSPGEHDCDGDGVPNVPDNCPNWPNPDQNLPPWFVPADDPDCDGFSTAAESYIGTNPEAHCGVDAWPVDINNDTFVSIIGDVVLLTGNFGQSVPPAPVRYNIAPDTPDGFIDIFDIVKMTGFRLGQSCASP